MPHPVVAFLSAGRLQLKRPAADPEPLVSQYAESIRERSAQIRRRHSWKQQGRGAQFQGGVMWGVEGDDLGDVSAAIITSLSRGSKAGEIVYAVNSGKVAAVCKMDTASAHPEQAERRLFHSVDNIVGDLCAEGREGFIACSTPTSIGVTNLAVMLDDGSDLVEVTSGDSVDHAPRWLPGRDRQLVYQSAGVGRNAAGHFSGIGPFSVCCFDIPGNLMETLRSSNEHEFLQPRVDDKMRLFCIRRPYRSPQQGPSVWRALLDFVLFPFRLLSAVFGYLNFFTAKYTGKPLTTAGGPEKKRADARQLMVWGNLLSASQEADHSGANDDEPQPYAPRTWELVRYDGSGDHEGTVLAKSVLNYDLGPDGRIVFSTGAAIILLGSNNSREVLAKADDISEVIIVSGAA